MKIFNQRPYVLIYQPCSIPGAKERSVGVHTNSYENGAQIYIEIEPEIQPNDFIYNNL